MRKNPLNPPYQGEVAPIASPDQGRRGGVFGGIFWRQLGRLFAISWSLRIAYRGEIYLWLIATMATPLLSLAIWHAVARSSTNLMPEEILTYYILVMIVRDATTSWRGYYLIQKILNGDIVGYLIRPPAIYWEHIITFITNKVFSQPPLLFVFAILFLTAPDLFSLSIFSPDRLPLFATSLILAMVLSFTFDLSLGLTAFWLEDAQELMAYRFLLTQIASGILIPFALMPSWLHTTLSFLPFRYTVSAPVEILLGQVTGPAAWRLLGIQSIWVAAFIVLLRVLYVRGLKRYAIPGQ